MGHPPAAVVAHPSKLAGLPTSDSTTVLALHGTHVARIVQMHSASTVGWRGGRRGVCLSVSVSAEPTRLLFSLHLKTHGAHPRSFPKQGKTCRTSMFATLLLPFANSSQAPTRVLWTNSLQWHMYIGLDSGGPSQSIPSIAQPRNLGSQSGSKRICGQMGLGPWANGEKWANGQMRQRDMRSSNVTLRRHRDAAQA